jgi:transposase-like protein
MRNRLSETAKQQCIEMAANGMSSSQISKQTGINRNTIQAFLRRKDAVRLKRPEVERDVCYKPKFAPSWDFSSHNLDVRYG